jgi:hypothetical protein
MTCHFEGGVSPFAIETYAQAVMYAPAAAAAMHARTMPPWPPAAECNDYVADRSLADEHRALVDAWIEAGTPEGDPAAEAPPLDVEIQALSRVDLRLEMPEAYTPTKAPDDYRCFVLPWPESYEQTVYVTGMAVAPGNVGTVHHVIAYLAPPSAAAEYEQLDAADSGPGYTCFGDAGGDIEGSFGGWTPGSLGSDTPPGIGTAVEPGSLVVLQMHYNTLGSGDAGPDRTAIELKIDTEVEKPAFILPVLDIAWFAGGLPIPAGEPDVVHRGLFDPRLFGDFDRLTIYTALSHMHLLGTRSRMFVQRADGTEECILQIDDWDFDWQDFYTLRETMEWRDGDLLGIECHYDNTAANQPLVDGERLEPRDVDWGEGTTDEMCIGFVMVTAE